MQKTFIYLAIIFPLLCLNLVLSCGTRHSDKLTIAVAANMQFAMEELKVSFEKETTISCELIIGSSGKLTAQIKEGAPFDIFISADVKYPMELYNNGYTISEPTVYSFGNLVLWTLSDFEPTIERLTNKEIKHIALANPKTAPYGSAAIEVLKHYTLMDSLQNKLVYGESISQTNQFIISQAADVGFTAKSVVLSPQMRDMGRWIAISDDIHTPIAQGVVILKNRSTQLENSRQFVDFLIYGKGKDILTKFGYTVVN